MTPVSLRALSFRLLPLVACLLLAIAASLPAQTAPVCGPSPQVQAALDKVPANQTSDQSQYEFVQSRRTAIQALMRRFPGDMFVESAYIGSMQYYESDNLKVVDEYKARHEQQPDNAQVTYLYGTTLVNRDTRQAIKLFNEALDKAPNLFLPHLEFVTIYTSPNFLDKAQAISHEKAFLAACPTPLEGYSSLQEVDDKELIAQSIPKLRQILEPRTDPAALSAYGTLWSLEFKARPPSEYDALRKQISADVARIRALNLQNSREWWSALQDGYKLSNDPKQSQWARSELETRFPLAREKLLSQDQWSKDHPHPNDDAPFDQKQAYERELLKQTDDWIKQRPNTIDIWYDRLGSMEYLDEVPASEVEACVNRVLELAQADAGPNPVDSNTRFRVAEALYKRKLDPQRQVEMARKGVQQLDEEAKQPPYDLYGKKLEEDLNFYRANQKTQGLFYEADGYVRLKQPNDARAALAQFVQALQAMKAQINDKDDRRKDYAGQESSYWNAMARLGQLQNRKLDAMAYYQSALLDRLDSGALPALGQKDDLADDAHDLWASLGGTDEGWKSWYGDRAAALANQSHLTWESAQDPLPPFQLTDLQGKTWQLADLKGKVVFLNFWASW
jgi:hypothetical protein